MTIQKCVTALNQGGWHAEVGQMFDSTNVMVVTYPTYFQPVSAQTTYTQTYSTAATTVPAATAAAVVTTAAGLAIYGFTQAQADAIPVAINANAADILALKKVVTQIIDDLQAAGLAL